MNRSGDSDSESPDEYEIMRKKNIAEKERMFAELGLDNVIGDTKKVLENFLKPSDNKPRKQRKRTQHRNTKQQSEILPTRRSLRIEKKYRKIKRVRGFKGFSKIDSTISDCNSDCGIKEEIKESNSPSDKKITVRFPWHNQLCSKINSSSDQSVGEKKEIITCEIENSSDISSLELTEDTLLKKIMKYSSLITAYEKRFPSDISDDDSDWDEYDNVEFCVSASEEESDCDSSLNSSEDLCQGRTRREGHRRPSHLGVPSLSPEDLTESMLKNIVKRGMNKIWDSEKGTTCHQCRQKTLDTKTVCRSKRCVGVRGMFCGLCLPNRYGETVEAALKNPEWECPVCRGICNCSFCRARAGKNPTGILYPMIKSHGYENVAAFLKECDKENNSSGKDEKKRVKVVCVRENS